MMEIETSLPRRVLTRMPEPVVEALFFPGIHRRRAGVSEPS